jgi:hypothetical protein
VVIRNRRSSGKRLSTVDKGQNCKGKSYWASGPRRFLGVGNLNVSGLLMVVTIVNVSKQAFLSSYCLTFFIWWSSLPKRKFGDWESEGYTILILWQLFSLPSCPIGRIRYPTYHQRGEIDWEDINLIPPLGKRFLSFGAFGVTLLPACNTLPSSYS